MLASLFPSVITAPFEVRPWVYFSGHVCGHKGWKFSPVFGEPVKTSLEAAETHVELVWVACGHTELNLAVVFGETGKNS